MLQTFRLSLLTLLIVGLGAAASLAADTTPTPLTAESLEALLEKANESGATIIVMSPGAGAADPSGAVADAGEEPALSDVAMRTRNEFRAVLASSTLFVRHVGATLAAASPDGDLWWLVIAVVTAVAGLIAGELVARPPQRWARQHFSYVYNPEPGSHSEKIVYLLFRAASGLVAATLVFLVAALVAVVFDTGHEPTRQTIFVIVVTYTAYRALRGVVLWNLLAPDAPSHRMLNLTDETARALYTRLAWLMALTNAMFGLCAWMDELGLNRDAHKLSLIFSTLVAAVILGWLTITYRADVAGAILGAGEPGRQPFWRRLLASTWHVVMILYLMAAWMERQGSAVGHGDPAVARQLIGAGPPRGNAHPLLEEMSGAGASRIATLLPLFRNFLVFTIFIIGNVHQRHIAACWCGPNRGRAIRHRRRRPAGACPARAPKARRPVRPRPASSSSCPHNRSRRRRARYRASPVIERPDTARQSAPSDPAGRPTLSSRPGAKSGSSYGRS